MKQQNFARKGVLMAESRPSISVVVPVYFAERTLATLVERLTQYLAGICDEYEILLVNDGSTDGSWAQIDSLSQQYASVRGFDLMRNFGQHNALLCGIRNARHEITVTMDDDLQHDPQSIGLLLAELAKGYDVVYGSPKEEKHGMWRDMASVITKMTLSTVMNTRNARHVSALRMFYTRLRQAFENYDGPSVSIDVLLSWGTSRFSHVEVEHHERAEGTSHYTFKKLVVHAINMITGFSTLPLRLSAILGFVLTLFGIGILLYVFINYLINGGVVPGFTFMTSVIAIFSGAQLFSLGILGEYFSRMYQRSMNRPSYIVKEKTIDK